MRAALVVTGVLGSGTALVFAAAALAASLFPNGTMVNAGWSGPVGWGKGGGWVNGAVPVPLPVPMPPPQGQEGDIVVPGAKLIPMAIEAPGPTDGDVVPQR